jgi:excisionase family DNA binding protein
MLATNINDADLLSREQAAKRLNISTRNLDYLREAGRLPFIRIGRRVVFSPMDLEQFTEAQKVPIRI